MDKQLCTMCHKLGDCENGLCLHCHEIMNGGNPDSPEELKRKIAEAKLQLTKQCARNAEIEKRNSELEIEIKALDSAFRFMKERLGI